MHIAAGLRDGAKQDSVVEVRAAISLQINMNIFLNKEGMLKNIVKKQIIFPAFHYDAYLCRDILIINIYLLLQWERICYWGVPLAGDGRLLVIRRGRGAGRD